MSQQSKLFRFLMVIMIFTTACGTQTILSQTEEKPVSKAVVYKEVLGKSMNDEVVVDFVANKQCSSVLPYVLCKDAGMALMIGSSEIVQGVFLYLNKSAGFIPYQDEFTPYKGELPFGLKFYDTMAAVEYKLGQQGIGENGLPDSGSTPDHIHYMAVYEQAGMTIIYNSPQDEDAMIHAILVQK